MLDGSARWDDICWEILYASNKIKIHRFEGIVPNFFQIFSLVDLFIFWAHLRILQSCHPIASADSLSRQPQDDGQ